MHGSYGNHLVQNTIHQQCICSTVGIRPTNIVKFPTFISWKYHHKLEATYIPLNKLAIVSLFSGIIFCTLYLPTNYPDGLCSEQDETVCLYWGHFLESCMIPELALSYFRAQFHYVHENSFPVWWNLCIGYQPL